MEVNQIEGVGFVFLKIVERESGEVPKAFKKGTNFLFLEVDNVDEALQAMKGAPVVAPMHTTFYGATEFTVKDPAGHLVTFAQFGKKQ